MRAICSTIFLCLIATVAVAQDIEVGLRHLIVNAESTGNVGINASRGFAGTAELFLSPRFSTELSAGFTNPEATLTDGTDLGTLGLQTTALTARWNFATQSRLSGFVGAGPALVTIGNLDDQTAEAIEVDFDREVTFVAEAGLRFHTRRAPRLSLIVTLSYMPLAAEPNVRRANVALPDELALDPLTVGVGASWRF